MSYRDFTSKPIWQKGLLLLLDIYKITKNFPKDERFALVSDMRRSSNSIIHNFAEGFGRYEKKDKTRFYKISRGSAYELISQLYASQKLEYISSDTSIQLIGQCKEIITEEDNLIISLENSKFT